jgi:hypothetical protein
MSKYTYQCYFDTWEGFMDGVLITPEYPDGMDFDFQSNDPILGGENTDHVLVPFTEEEAAKALALLLDCKPSDILFDYDGDAEPLYVG